MKDAACRSNPLGDSAVVFLGQVQMYPQPLCCHSHVASHFGWALRNGQLALPWLPQLEKLLGSPLGSIASKTRQ